MNTSIRSTHFSFIHSQEDHRGSICSIFSSILTGVLFLFPGFLLNASPSSDEEDSPAGQTASGLVLPAWGEGECRESFDVRIWPCDVIVWLEQENVRDMIADPATEEGERRSLQQILALQRAWRSDR